MKLGIASTTAAPDPLACTPVGEEFAMARQARRRRRELLEVPFDERPLWKRALDKRERTPGDKRK